MAYCVNGCWTVSGHVGAGTETPSLGFTAAGAAVGDAAIGLNNTSGGGKSWQIYSTGTSFSQGNCNLIFYRGGVDGANATMTLDWSGHVGIGTWAPTEMLHICTATGAGPEVKLQNSVSSHYIRAYDDNFNILMNASVTALSIKNCGYVGIGTTSANTYGALAIRRAVCLNSKNVSFSTSDAINSTFDIRHPGPSIVDLSSENSDLTFSTNTTGTDGTERIRITSGGNVGIGTCSPTSKLTVAGDVSIGSSIGSSTYTGPAQYGALTFPRGQILYSNTNAQSQFYFVSNATLNASSQFAYTCNGRAGKINIDDGSIALDVASCAAAGGVVSWTTGINILSSGNVGVGTGSPAYKLDIQNSVASYLTRVCNNQAGDAAGILVRGGSNATNEIIAAHDYSGNPRLLVGACGNVSINNASINTSYKLYVNGAFYAAGSSCEYKTQICQYNTDSCMFMKLTPVTYQYKDEYCHLGKELKSGTQIGLIAEDVAEVYPELAILKDEDDMKIVRNVDYEKLSIVLLSEVQKLRKELDELKTK